MTPDAYVGLALPASAVALLVAAAWGRPAAKHDRVTREGGTVFLSEQVMQRAYIWIDRLAALSVRLGVTADAVTWLSVVLGLAAGVLAAVACLGAGAWALALSGLCDGLDGAVARRTGTASPAGAVLDSALDRYVEFFFCAGVLVLFAGKTLVQLLVIIALFGGFMVTYSTAKAEALGIRPPRGWMKRPERLVWLIGGAALSGLTATASLLFALGVIAVFAHLSAALRLRALVAATRQST